MTMLVCARHTGQQSSVATLFAQLSQKRACPHGTIANPSLGATRQTSQESTGSPAAAAASSSSLLSLSLAAVWAPTEWLTARWN